jgi:hypothetical protein
MSVAPSDRAATNSLIALSPLAGTIQGILFGKEPAKGLIVAFLNTLLNRFK